MKKIFIIILIILLIILLGGCFMYIKNRPKKINNIEGIKSFYYFYTVGYHYEASIVYEIECDDKCTLKIKPEGVTIEDASIYEIDKDVVEKLKDILNKYRVGRWNGFDGNDRNVLDGNSFELSVKMNNGDEVYARGYMKWPRNYQDVKKEIIDLFNQYE